MASSKPKNPARATKGSALSNPHKTQPKKVSAKATPEQGPEYQALLDEAAATGKDMRHTRGLSRKQAGTRSTPASDRQAPVTLLNPSPATRLKKGENAVTLRRRNQAAELASPTAQEDTPRKVHRKSATHVGDSEVTGAVGVDPGTRRPPESWAQHAIDAEERKRLAKEAGLTPLEFLMSIMCDSGEKLYVRMDAAKMATPYFHKKMPIAVDTTVNSPVGCYTKDQLSRLSTPELVQLEQLMTKLSDATPVPTVPANADPLQVVAATDAVANAILAAAVAPAVAQSQQEDDEDDSQD